MTITNKIMVEIEAKELKRFLREVLKLAYDDGNADVTGIRDYADAMICDIEAYEKSP